ncbi:tRNA adenosine(34) deaminase TadA [Alloalcanivorax sp. C16-1]|uniref:tRNA adenosine(34) deaminase TadA n=1 Tax=Alloalcanivorax sp. C16-1 TaxID=3390051 RepID=UPI003970DC07
MQDDEYWMDRALALAERAGAEGEVPVGALVVRDGEVLGEGWNRPIGAHDPTGHAEVNALRDAAARQGNYRLPGATLYVTIEPCTMCFGALMHARIARLVYGAREPRAGVCESQLGLPERTFYNHRVEVVSGVAAERAAELLRTFFRRRRG